VKLIGFIVALLGSSCIVVCANAREVISCKSPDGKFALRHVHEEKQPYAGDTAIIEVATGKTVAPLDSNWSIGELKLLWFARFSKSFLFRRQHPFYGKRWLLDPRLFPERLGVR